MATIMWAGCGSDKAASGSPTSLGPADITTILQGDAGRDFPEEFVSVAKKLAPVPVFGLRVLPAEMEVVDYWWPVVDVESPEQYQGPQVANPRIDHERTDQPEAQILLRWGNGWVVLLENFRGDVGLTSGEDVGLVAGHKAMLYRINGGLLIQWSEDGRWYGLFARTVPEEELKRLALQVEKVEY